MNAGLVACTAVAAFVAGSIGTDLRSTPRSVRTDATIVSDPGAYGTVLAQEKGRFKQEGDNCVWDANDGGPNQCTPITRGRFKKGGDDSCTWDSTDNGPDQCKPPKGRWKQGGDGSCSFDAKDDGPDQCNPRRARGRARK
jgi:hypothetical protein